MISDFQRHKLTHFFNVLDYDQNGAIEQADFEVIARNLAAVRGFRPGSTEQREIRERVLAIWHKLRQVLDQNTDQRATLVEWLHYHEQFVFATPDGYEQHGTLSVEFLFDLMDADGDGQLTAKEYRDLFVSFHLDELVATEVFRRLDQNGDGFLSRAELIAAVADFHFSDDPRTAGNWLFGPFVS